MCTFLEIRSPVCVAVGVERDVPYRLTNSREKTHPLVLLEGKVPSGRCAYPMSDGCGGWLFVAFVKQHVAGVKSDQV